MNKRKLLHSFITLSLVLTSNASVLANPLANSPQLQAGVNQQITSFSEAEDRLYQLELNIEKLDVQIEELMRVIDDNTIAITEGEQAIIKAQDEVKKVEEDIIAKQSLYNDRMRAIYKSGINSYIQVLFDSKNLRDFIIKADSITRISKFDKGIVKDLNEKEETLKQKIDKLELENNRITSLKAENQEKLSALKNAKESQLPLIEQARAESTRQQFNSKEENEKINNAKAKINAMYTNTSILQNSMGIATFSVESVAVYACSFLGTTYVYGGTTPDPGFDCSGFVRYIYARFGIYLPRTSKEQFNTGTPVAPGDLSLGDLVFFGDGGEVSHVGMYVGDGCYIHAPRTGDIVKISVLSSKRYMGARRAK